MVGIAVAVLWLPLFVSLLYCCFGGNRYVYPLRGFWKCFDLLQERELFKTK